jgi:hypothetical protein
MIPSNYLFACLPPLLLLTIARELPRAEHPPSPSLPLLENAAAALS